MNQQRNFATHPRTRKESLELIIKAAKKGRLIGGSFSEKGCYCAIGCLLTAKQRKDLREKCITSDTELIDYAGAKNIKVLTSFSVDEVRCIISHNDSVAEYKQNRKPPYTDVVSAKSDFIQTLKGLLNNPKRKITHRIFLWS